MDSTVLRRLDCLSKKQLLAAIIAITQECDRDSMCVSRLLKHLDSIPPASGSNRKMPMASAEIETYHTADERTAKDFSIEKYRTRQIALQVQYDGTSYLGFASQDLEETVENHLFNALLKLKLIEDRKTCKYSRCGRTDKGVSALGQVISLNVRSALPKDLPDELLQRLTHPSDKVIIPATDATVVAAGDAINESISANTSPLQKKTKKNKGNATSKGSKDRVIQEMDYVTMLNRSLPEDIRVLGWAPVTDEFSARFSASHRMYRYFFQRKQLNLNAMKQAAALLVGEHDCRNICKMDIANVSNFRREIYSAEILPFPVVGAGCKNNVQVLEEGADRDCVNATGYGEHMNFSEEREEVYMLEIKGIAFLWHMVRCIMSVLFMVGEGLEEPTIVKHLFDIDACPGKPPYPLAPEQPLVLHECGFDNLRIPMQPRHMWQLTAHYRSIREGHLISAARALNSLELVLNSTVRTKDLPDFLGGLEQLDQRHSKKLQQFTSASGSDSVGDTASLKRKHTALKEPDRGEVLPAATVSAGSGWSVSGEKEEMIWAHVLEKVEREMGHTPKLKYAPHVPLKQRRMEDTYEEKVRQLAGVKKERLDRHVTLSTSAAVSGATPAFFENMRKQGSLP